MLSAAGLLRKCILASLCKDCHFAEHREDKAAGKKAHEYKTKSDCRDGYHFDEFGQVVPD